MDLKCNKIINRIRFVFKHLKLGLVRNFNL